MKTVIYGVLEEEKQRNLEAQDVYKNEILMLSKGSVSKKIISGNTYYYLKYREGKKTKNDYLGKDKSVADELKRQVERRRYLESVLRRLKKEYKQICKVVKD